MWLARSTLFLRISAAIADSVLAAVFGYFEQLLHLRSAEKVAEESRRIEDFNHVLEVAGYDLSMIEDFKEETMDLLGKVQHAISVGELDGSILLQAFNVEEVSSSIVFHFKVSGLVVKEYSLAVSCSVGRS